jgi:formylglycine-generating enzyme required for sulfatase activity
MTAADGGAAGLADPATVSSFRLDKYLVTVGRFRQFVSAWNQGSGWLPRAASGKHTHLNAGNGLNATGGGYESGWVTSDDSNIAPSDTNLGGSTKFAPTWTVSPGSNENLPIDGENWWEAYAFCIWDGGFLPSEAEWAYAAAGGGGQREYPWGGADPGTINEYAIYGDLAGNGNCYYPDGGTCTGTANIAPVGTATSGAGLWGQLDLAGNVWEWNLDWYATYVNPCADCANLAATTWRVGRGGDFYQVTSYLLSPYRGGIIPSYRNDSVGFRCARTP